MDRGENRKKEDDKGKAVGGPELLAKPCSRRWASVAAVGWSLAEWRN